VWEPSREELLSAAGLLNEEFSSDDDSYDPDEDPILFERDHLGGLWDGEPIEIDSSDEENEDAEDYFSAEQSFLLASALSSAMLTNFALAVAAGVGANRGPRARAPAAARVLPPNLRDAIRRPRRFGRR